MLRLRLPALLAIAACCVSFAVAQEKEPAKDLNLRKITDEQLQALLKQFPQADANKDGKLTIEEATAYRKTVVPQRNAKDRPNAPDRPTPTQADVSYGDHPRNVFDFYQAKSDKPTPLIIYIHGGGFVAGDKNSINPAMVKLANDAGISMASLHYRFVNGEDILFPTPQRDCCRALQFLRYHAKDYNIDPKRIACYGGSAGAGNSMYIGFHEDLADPKSDDPIARESTRICAVGTLGGQSTYDPIEIQKLVGGRAHEHSSIYKVYGIKTYEELMNPPPEKKKLYDEAAAIKHLTKDDPPLYMYYSEPDVVPEADSPPGKYIHHPNFGKQLQKAMNELGIENVYVHNSTNGGGRDTVKEMFEFFQKAFAKVE